MYKVKYGIIFVIFLIMQGCSTFYKVDTTAQPSHLKYNRNTKDIKKGITRMFVREEYPKYLGGFRELSSRLLDKNDDFCGLYEGKNNIYFLSRGSNKRYSKKFRGILSEDSYILDDLASVGRYYDLYRIDSSRIKCNNKSDYCIVKSDKLSSVILIKLEDDKHIDFEFADYSIVKNNYLKALEKYNLDYVKNYKNTGVKQFLTLESFNKAIYNATTLKEVDIVEKIADRENIQLSKKLILSRKNQITFNKNYVYYLSNATEKELDELLKNKQKLVGVSKEKIAKLKKLQKKYKFERMLKSNSTDEVKGYYNKTKNKKIKEHLIALYRKQHTLDGYIDAFYYSKEKQDIKNSYKIAKNTTQKARAEKALISGLGYNKFFNIKLVGTDESKIKTVGKNVLFNLGGSSISGKDFVKYFRLSGSSSLKYGSYKVKVKFILTLRYKQTYLMFSKEYDVKKSFVATYNINKANNYTDEQQVVFKDVIASRTIGALGMDAMSIKDRLIKAEVSYKIIDVE